MKKIIIALLFLSKLSFGQVVDLVSDIRFENFKQMDKISKTIRIESVPDILLDKNIIVTVGKKKIQWTFASKTEFEEIRGGEVKKGDSRYYFPVKILAHDYAKPHEKFMFDLVLTYLDARTGLQFEYITTISATKIN